MTSEEKVHNLLEAEVNLRKMLDNYSAKYSKLLKSLSTSNESFDKVKKEMEKVIHFLILLLYKNCKILTSICTKKFL